MRRWTWVGVVVLASASAHADDRCAAIAPTVFPPDGATDVPLDAKLFVVGGEQSVWELRGSIGKRRLDGAATWSRPAMTRIDPQGLAANFTYTLTRDGVPITTFTTGERADTTPPDAPVLAGIAGEPGQPLVPSVLTDEDHVATWVTVTRWGERRATQWQLFPSQGIDAAVAACSRLTMPDSASTFVELRSFDLAGNLSSIASRCTPLAAASRRGGPPRRARHAPELVVFLTLLLPLAAAAGVGWGVARGYRARRRFERTTAMSLEAIEVVAVAAAARPRHVAIVAGGLAGLTALRAIPFEAFCEWLPLLVPAMAAVIARTLASTIAGLRAHRAIGLLQAGAEATTDARAFIVIVDRGALRALLEVRGFVLPRATTTEIPRATLRRQRAVQR